jgi:hypothetical protein
MASSIVFVFCLFLFQNHDIFIIDQSGNEISNNAFCSSFVFASADRFFAQSHICFKFSSQCFLASDRDTLKESLL